MHSPRPILVALTVVLLAVAQQFCCCVPTSTIQHAFVTAHEPEGSSGVADLGWCCHHAPALPGSTSETDPHDGPKPPHQDCSCNAVRTLAPVQRGVSVPVLDASGCNGSLPDFAAICGALRGRSEAQARPPGWTVRERRLSGGDSARSGIPLWQGVLLTV